MLSDGQTGAIYGTPLEYNACLSLNLNIKVMLSDKAC